MRKKSIILVCVITIICLIMSNFLLTNDIFLKSLEETTVFNLYVNDDGGVGFLCEEVRYSQDLHTTYYAIETLKSINNYFSKKKLEGKVNIVLPKIYYSHKLDDITEIYYTVGINKEQITSKKNMINKIKHDLEYLQTETGTFVYNKEQYKEIDEAGNLESLYASTLMGINMCKELNININEELTRKWLTKELIRFFCCNTNYNRNNTGNMYLLLNMCDMLDIDYSNYLTKINLFFEKFENDIIYSINNNQAIPVIYIETYINLNNILNLDINDEINNVLYNYILECQNNDGGFGIEPHVDSSIMPTFLCVSILQELDCEINNLNKIIALIQKYKLTTGYYIPLANIDSNIIDTYYAHKINKEIKNINYDLQLQKYLLANKNLEDMTISQKSKYYLMCKDLDIINEIDIKNIKSILIDLLNNQNQKNNYEYPIILYNLVFIINYYDEEFILDNKKEILMQLNLENNSINSIQDELEIIYLCNKIKILKLIDNFSDDLISELEDILYQKINKTFSQAKYSEMLLLYEIFSAFDTCGIEIKPKIYKKLNNIFEECYYQKGLYKLGRNSDSVVCYESCFYGIWLKKYIFNKE